MTRKSYLLILFLSILIPFVLFLSYNLVGKFTLTDYSIDNLPGTYSIESNLLLMMGNNKLNPALKRYVDNIKELSYVESVESTIKGTEIKLSGNLIDEGVIITDGENWYFYSDSFSPLSQKDVYFLKDEYIILSVPSTLLEIFTSSSPSKDETKMIDTLKTLKPRSGLITKAEYGNNNSNIISGELSVTLSDINSKLVFEDIREIERLEEAVNILEKEYTDSKEMHFCDNITYVLSNGLLIRMR